MERLLDWLKRYDINKWIHSRTEIFWKRSESWIRFKADLKNVTGVGTSNFAKKFDFASLKSEVDKSDIDKLEKVLIGLNSSKGKVDKLDVDKSVHVPEDLIKASDAVKNDVIKKTKYDKLLKKLMLFKLPIIKKIWFLVRIYCTGNDGYQKFQVFAPMLNSLKLNHLTLILNQFLNF